MKNRMYFSAYESMISSSFVEFKESEISNIISKIDTTILLADGRLDSFFVVKGLEYAHAIRAFQKKRYDLSLSYLSKVTNKKLLPYVYFLKGEIYYTQKKYSYSNNFFLRKSISII